MKKPSSLTSILVKYAGKKYSLATRIIVPLVTISTILLVKLLTDPLTANRFPFIFFFLGIIISAWFGGVKSGIFATLISTVIIDYFFLTPIHNILFNDLTTWVNIIIFMTQGIIISYIFQSMVIAIRREKASHQGQIETSIQLRTIIDGASDLIMIKDRLGRYILINPATQKLFGKTKNKIIGLNDRQLFPAKIASRIMLADKKVMETGISEIIEETFIVNGQERFYLCTKSPHKYPNGDIIGVIDVAHDITERKLAEEQKDDFIGIASHELKTPLTSIKGYVQIIEKMMFGNGHNKTLQYISRTLIYINKLESLINELLDVSRIKAGKLQFNTSTFSFSDLVSDGIESVKPIVEQHQIILRNEVTITITGDKNRLEQVFTNLLSNAIKYSPKTDKIFIDVKKKDHIITVAVTDHGIGIPEEKQSHVFDRFYRVDDRSREFTGLGVGLYIASEIIKRHSGKMWVESEVGKGSTFYFSLPIVTKDK